MYVYISEPDSPISLWFDKRGKQSQMSLFKFSTLNGKAVYNHNTHHMS